MKKVMQWVMTAALLCCIVVFVSCSNSDNPSGDSKKVQIAMISQRSTIEYWQQMEKGFRNTCKAKNLEGLFYTTQNTNYQEQIAAVKDLEKRGDKNLKGIIYSPCYGENGETADAEVAAFAKKHNIPVIILDTKVLATSPLASCPFIGIDNAEAGKQMASYVTPEKVAVFAITNSPAVDRADAFKTIKPNADVYLINNSYDEVKAAVDKYDDFVFFNGSTLSNNFSLFKTNNKNVYTFDIYGEFLDELISGSSFFKGVMVQNTFGMVEKAVEVVLSNAKEDVMVPTFFVTKDNLDDPKLKPFLEFYKK